MNSIDKINTVAGLNDKIPSGFGPVETPAMIYDLRLTRRLAQGLG